MNEIEKLIKQGDLKQAWQKVQAFIQRSPCEPIGIILAAKIQLKANMANKAIFTLNHALNNDNNYQTSGNDLKAFLTHILCSLQQIDKAKQICTTIEVTKLQLADSFHYLANSLAKMDDFSASLACYQLGLSKFPDHIELLEGAANLEIIAGNFNQAENLITQAITQQPENGRFYWLLSDIAKNLNIDKVKQLYQLMLNQFNTLKSEATNVVYWYYGLGNTALTINDYQSAAVHYQKGALIRRSEYKGYKVEDEINWLIQVKNVQANLSPLQVVNDEVRPTPIFIIGMPRSGTTLLATLLSKYENIYDLGELPLLPQLAQELAIGKINLEQVRKKYMEEVTARTNNTRYIIDQLPTNFININLIKCAFPDAKLILVNRNINDIFISNFCFLFAPNAMPFTYNSQELVTFIKRFKLLTSEVSCVVNYEDIVLETEDTINTLLMNQNIKAGSKGQQQTYVATGSSVQVRKPIYKTSVNKWKKFQPYFADILPIQIENSADNDTN